MSARKKGILADLKKKKGRAFALGGFLLLALWIWSGILFKKEKAPFADTPVIDYNSPEWNAEHGAGQATLLASGPKKGLPPITSYEAAMARIKTWSGPLGLHLDRDDDLEIFNVGKLAMGEILKQKTDPKRKDISLDLTGTVILGKTRMAVFQDKRVKEGQQIGRYVIQAVRPREVDILDIVEGAVRTLRMGAKDLSGMGSGSKNDPSTEADKKQVPE
ncbi:MAG: hypothetical protein ACE5H3_02260 [Planctomycetota bacterium]